MSTFDVQHLSLPLYATDWAGDDVLMHIMRAPENGQGGGLTILNAYVVPGANTGAGTAHTWQLENWDTAGTAIKASGGTVATAVGGTASPFTAQTPVEFTLSNAFLDAGEWLVLRKNETNSSDPTLDLLEVEYVMGK